jgi:hypothetical protein
LFCVVLPQHHPGVFQNLKPNDPQKIVNRIPPIWGHEAATNGVSCGTVVVVRKKSATLQILEVALTVCGPFWA